MTKRPNNRPNTKASADPDVSSCGASLLTNNPMFKIEKGIPVPGQDSISFFMKSMDVGDSFVAASGDKEAVLSKRTSVSNVMQFLSKNKKQPMKYVSKVLPFGSKFELRVWRIA